MFAFHQDYTRIGGVRHYQVGPHQSLEQAQCDRGFAAIEEHTMDQFLELKLKRSRARIKPFFLGHLGSKLHRAQRAKSNQVLLAGEVTKLK